MVGDTQEHRSQPFQYGDFRVLCIRDEENPKFEGLKGVEGVLLLNIRISV